MPTILINLKYMKNFFFIITLPMLLAGLWGCSDTLRREDTVPEEGQIKVTFELVSNVIAEGPRYLSKFILENNSTVSLEGSGWAMYYNQVTRMPITETVPDIVNIEHINGDFYRMTPGGAFSLEPGEIVEIPFESEDWLIKRSDAPSGVYFVFTDDEGSEISRIPVYDLEVIPFSRPEQIHRFKDDQTAIPTPEWQYEQNEKLSHLDESLLLPIIPTPVNFKKQNGTVTIGDNLMIHHEAGLGSQASILAAHLTRRMGKKPMVMESTVSGAGIISLRTGDVKVNGKHSETYLLKADRALGILIEGSDPAGVFYGIQSLLALLQVKSSSDSLSVLEVPSLQIADAPAFEYRGMHFDVARNFQKKETVLKFLDLMAFYKLNKFHFHLTDDEGWRLEIEELPELTSLGAYRGHTLDDSEYLAPAYGSGPFPDPEVSHGSGYYTRKDFIEILKYAADRHIEVIPEVNMPGHARAAIKAMEYRYRKLMDDGRNEEAEKYLLSDPDDQSQYISAQLYNDNVVCVCRESVFTFYETVINDIIEMYQEARLELRMIHTGGDEVPQGAWESSPLCNALLERNPDITDYRNLQPYFFSRLTGILEAHHLIISGWEEVAMSFLPDGGWEANPEFANGNVIPYVWNSLWGNQDLGYRLANGGYPVILCNVNNFYFDLAYNKDPYEPGAYWGGFVDTRDAFSFIPFDLYKSMDYDVMGQEFDMDRDFKNMERLRPDAFDNILGLQGEMWSETVKGPLMLEYYSLPKIIGLAQRAWEGTPPWAGIEDKAERNKDRDEAWNVFANTLAQRDLPRLDYLFGGFNYRLAPPGARIREGKLEANTAFPGLAIRYTTDGSDPDSLSLAYQEPVEVSGKVKLKSFSASGRGGRTVEVQ